MGSLQNGSTVRLRSQGRFLVAVDDKGSVTQAEDGGSNNAIWTIELNTTNQNIRFKSCHNLYLTTSTERFRLIGRKVIQSRPLSGSSMEWRPITYGDNFKFQTQVGTFLRADDGGVPSWRNMVTHKVPRRRPIYQGYLWHVDLATKVHGPASMPPAGETPAPRINRHHIRDAAIVLGAAAGVAGTTYGIVHEEEDAPNNEAPGDTDDDVY